MVHEDGIFPLEMCQYCKVGYADLKGHQDRDCCAGNKPRGEPLPDFPMFEFRDKTVKVKEEKVHFFFFFFFSGRPEMFLLFRQTRARRESGLSPNLSSRE